MTAPDTPSDEKSSGGPSPVGARWSIGVVRAPDASNDGTIAEIEARVVRTELERRLGPVTLDLRTAGEPSGPWAPLVHAAWPGEIDASIELGVLGELASRLITLFPRTIDPVAADIRRRMLEHLSILPVAAGSLTDDLLAELLPAPARPTDLWLVVRDVHDLATTEPAHAILRAAPEPAVAERLDTWFDEAVANASTGDARSESVHRLRTEAAELRSRLADAESGSARVERLAAERLDVLEAERNSLRERLTRAEIDLGGQVTG